MNELKQKLRTKHNEVTNIFNNYIASLEQSVEDTYEVLSTLRLEVESLQDQRNRLLTDIDNNNDMLISLQKQMDNITVTKNLVDKEIEKGKHKIKLNVGGSIFVTSKITLLSYEGSYFYGMLSSDNWQPNEDGEYFIDRDPIVFDRILNYLRDGNLDTDCLSDREVDILKNDLDYYCFNIDNTIYRSSISLQNDGNHIDNILVSINVGPLFPTKTITDAIIELINKYKSTNTKLLATIYLSAEFLWDTQLTIVNEDLGWITIESYSDGTFIKHDILPMNAPNRTILVVNGTAPRLKGTYTVLNMPIGQTYYNHIELVTNAKIEIVDCIINCNLDLGITTRNIFCANNSSFIMSNSTSNGFTTSVVLSTNSSTSITNSKLDILCTDNSCKCSIFCTIFKTRS
eukprot:TRINITY_DN13365_c0_g1_i1.p1 TRINITY_DN13365_c0_g1~~TRINITY_DN13365_c0_g1_i1.p1  ORF type:complete len:401 (-),score=34.16 TRINITY_DN13365_c0_g1_i1:41-1243(-)